MSCPELPKIWKIAQFSRHGKEIQEAEHLLVGAKFPKAIQTIKVKIFLKTWYFQNEVQPCKSHEIDDFMQWMGETGDWRYENKSMHAIYHLAYHHRRRWVTDEFDKKLNKEKISILCLDGFR